MTTWSDLLGLVDEVAELLPDVPRLTVLDAVDAECSRQCPTRSMLRAFVVPAAVWRLRSGVDLIGA